MDWLLYIHIVCILNHIKFSSSAIDVAKIFEEELLVLKKLKHSEQVYIICF